MNAASGENRKELSSSKILTDASFNGDCNEGTINVNKYNNKNKWDVKYIQMLTAPTEGATENIGEGLHYLEIYSM